MKYRIARFIAALLLASFVISFLDSCGMGRWRRYNCGSYYGKRKGYRGMHERRNRDW